MSSAGQRQTFHAREQEYSTVEELLAHVRKKPFPNGMILPVCIWGSRGIGKTAQVESYCDENNLDIKMYHPAHDKDGSDILGQKIIDEKTGKVTYALPDFLPVEGECKPEGVWFIDELNRASQNVLAGLMEPLGSGTISQSGWKIPPGWQIVAAANPNETGYMIQTMDEAMIDRMIHYNPGWEPAVWAAWAMTAGVPMEMIEFTMARTQLLASAKSHSEFQIPREIESKLVASPRSMTYLSYVYEPGMPTRILRALAIGLIGREATEELLIFLSQPATVLSIEKVISPPQQRENGTHIYPYEVEVLSWNAEPTKYDSAAFGTLNMVGAFLINNRPVSSDPEHEPYAQAIGRFLACISQTQRSFGLDLIRRIAFNWYSSILKVCDNWIQYFASTHQSLGAAGAGTAGQLNP